MAEANIKATITATDYASGVVAGFASSLDGAGLSFGKLTSGFVAGEAIFQGLEATFSEVTSLIGSLISKAEKYQDATVGLQTALNNNISIGDKNIDSLLKQADAMSNVTGFSEQQYVAADNLLAIHELSQAQITALIPTLADFAQGLADATGEMPDLQSATELVAKAIGENDAEGMSAALKRAGIALTAHQMAVLKTGNMTDKLSTITDLLSGKFQGLSTADQASIKMAILTNEMDKAQTKIGLALLPTLSGLATKLATFVESDKFQAWLTEATNWLSINLPKAMNWIINTGIPQMVRAFNDSKPVLQAVAEIIKTMFLPITAGISLIGDLKKAIDGLNNHKVDAGSIFGDLGKLVLPGPVQSLAHQLHVPGFAGGVTDFSGGLAMVGEQGEELVNLPPGSSVIPHNKVQQMQASSTVNLNVNVGVYAGTEVEKRKVAQSLWKSIQDAAAAKNMNVTDFMGMG